MASVGNPGDWTNSTTVAFLVDTMYPDKTFNRSLLGISVHSMSYGMGSPFAAAASTSYRLGEWNLPLVVEQELVDNRYIPASRVHSGINDLYVFRNWNALFNAYDQFCGRLGVPRDKFVINLAEAASYVEVPTGIYVENLIKLYRRGYRLFELENEPYNWAWRTSPHNGKCSRFPNSQTGVNNYVAYMQAIYTAAKPKMPDAKILASIWCAGSDAAMWGSATGSTGVMQAVSAYCDGYAIHQYVHGGGSLNVTGTNYNSSPNEYPRFALAEVKRCTDELITKAYNRSLANGKGPMYMTEFGIQVPSVRGGNNVALPALFHYYVLLLENAAIQPVPWLDFASTWQLFSAWSGEAQSGVYTYYVPTHSTSGATMRGWLHFLRRYLLEYLGPVYLTPQPTTGGQLTAPTGSYTDSQNISRGGLLTPFLMTLFPDSNLVTLLMANLSWNTSYTVNVQLKHFTLSSNATGNSSAFTSIKLRDPASDPQTTTPIVNNYNSPGSWITVGTGLSALTSPSIPTTGAVGANGGTPAQLNFTLDSRSIVFVGMRGTCWSE
jgi:hypothetical protein